MIFPVWQKLGQSSHLLAQGCGNILGTSATHTGTLDPMAKGVVVVLTDEDRYAKGLLSDWQKMYEFSILWGIQTDSGDRLGLIDKSSRQKPSEELLKQTLQNFPLSYEQQLPMFSSRRFEGKSGFDWAKESRELPVKTRKVELDNLAFTSSETSPAQELLSQHLSAVKQIEGDFRQVEILKSWESSISLDQNFLITYHSVRTSPGTYIRQLVQDIAKQLEIPATTWSITRTQNGPYTQQDCVELEELSEL